MAREDERPFLTLVMRCYRRPNMMTTAIQSALALKDPDVEIVLIPDFTGKGVQWANRQFGRHVDRVDGRYVYTLDDDSRIVDPRLVQLLKKAAQSDPGLIMVRSRRPAIQPYVLPKKSVWGRRDRLRVTSTNGGCFVSRADVWAKHAHRYGARGSGDWNYLNAVRKDKTVTFAWVPVIMKEAQQLSRGAPEANCRRDWFKRTIIRFGFVQVAPGDWRLPLWRMDREEIAALRKGPAKKGKPKRRAAPKRGAAPAPALARVGRLAPEPPTQTVIPASVRQMSQQAPRPHALLSRGRRQLEAR